jgi:hypothetical protein
MDIRIEVIDTSSSAGAYERHIHALKIAADLERKTSLEVLKVLIRREGIMNVILGRREDNLKIFEVEVFLSSAGVWHYGAMSFLMRIRSLNPAPQEHE